MAEKTLQRQTPAATAVAVADSQIARSEHHQEHVPNRVPGRPRGLDDKGPALVDTRTMCKPCSRLGKNDPIQPHSGERSLPVVEPKCLQTATIIIRVSGVRVPPPASRKARKCGLFVVSGQRRTPKP